MPETANLPNPLPTSDAALGSARTIRKLTSGEDFGETHGPTRAVCVGGAGTATLVDASGNTAADYPLQAGYNPLCVTAVTLGTASDVWGLW